MEQIRLLALTTILTVLTWTTADQFLKDRIEVQVPIHPVAPTGSNMIVRADGSGDGTPVHLITLEASRRSIDQLRGQEFDTVALRVPESPNGSRVIDLQAELPKIPGLFRGLRIVDVQPALMPLTIDHWLTEKAPVVLNTLGVDSEGTPTVEPPEVKVTFAETDRPKLERLFGRGVEVAFADIVRGATPGEPLRLAARLPTTIDQVPVRFEPDTVFVQATLRAQRRTANIPAVPILIDASPSIFNRFRIDLADGNLLLTRAITVAGPPAAIDALSSGATKVIGHIHITEALATLGQAEQVLEPEFTLPEGVRIEEPVEPVRFQLVSVTEKGT